MEITIDVPDELAATLRRTPEELRYDLRLRALAGLVERGLLSTGRAAELPAGALATCPPVSWRIRPSSTLAGSSAGSWSAS